MKKIAIMVILAIVALTGTIYASDFSVSVPMETGATAYWFPGDNTFAAGVSETVLRMKYAKLDKFSLDLDGTLAKEVNADSDTLYGIGCKVNYNIAYTNSSGITFEPSIGVTALRNMKNITKAADLLNDYRIAIYGNMVLYRW